MLSLTVEYTNNPMTFTKVDETNFKLNGELLNIEDVKTEHYYNTVRMFLDDTILLMP